MSASKRLLVHILLILSGAASLVYQVVWTRVLQTAFGNTDLAVTTVLAVFMGGLALGGYLGGRYAARLQRPILVYGLLEAGIAIYALIVTPMLYHLDFIYGMVGVDASASTLTLVRFIVSAVLLIVPTVCMGATLPVLTVPLVRLKKAGEGIGLLYFVNTLGAVLGSAMAGFVLIRFTGLAVSTFIAAGVGAAVMGGAVLLQRGLPLTREQARDEPATPQQPLLGAGLEVIQPRNGYLLMLLAAALCGYISLVNEVVYTRVLGIMLDGTVYGFSALLASFLMGIALGSLFISPFIDQSQDLWGLFAKIQIMAALGAIFTIVMIPYVPALVDVFMGSGTGVEGGFALKVLIVFMIVLVPSLFFGAAFPVCVTIASRYRGQVSGSLGSVYAANTAGCILGSISGGIVLIAITKDLNTILVLMVLLSLALALMAGGLSAASHFHRARLGPEEHRSAWQRLGWTKAAGLVALPMVVVIGVMALWPDMKVYRLVCSRYAVEDYDRTLGFQVSKVDKQVDRIVWKAQGRVTVVTVHRLSDGGLRLRNNGLNEAYHGTSEPRYAEIIFYLGMLPYMLHPKPEKALLIGLGGGGTAECLAKSDLKSLTVVELEPKVVEASKFIYRTLKGPRKHPAYDKRVTVRTDDGRNALLRAARAKPHQFDLIVSQPSHAWLSGVASLYTREHFRVVRRNLRKGGIFCQWINLFRMDEEGLGSLMAAFTEAFPSVHVFQVDSNSLLLLGGDRFLKLDPAVVQRHLQEPRLKKNADLFSIDANALFRKYLFGRQTALALARGYRTNSDRFPIIEMRLPWILHNDTVKMKKLLRRRKLAWGIRPGILHRSKGWKHFLKGLADDLITEFDADRLPLKRAKRFVTRAAEQLGKQGLMLRARLARLEGDMAQAARLYDQAARDGVKDAWLHLGHIHLLMERFRKASAACGRFYELTRRSDAHLCVAEANFRAGRWPEARSVLGAMVLRKELDEAPDARKLLGIMAYHQGNLTQARSHLSSHYEQNSADSESPYFLGLMEATRGNHLKAREYLAAAVSNATSLAETASSHGKRFAKRGHQEAAVAKFREALRYKRDLAAAYKWMAAALRRWGRFGELKQALDLFATRDPSGASTFRIDFPGTASLTERLGLILWRHREDLTP